MALEQYRRKRNFQKTPEPPPVTARSRADQLAYLIQKHDATHLHYDFRLELDGVLLSWAVTKGPSLNPSDKRLAVRTEDHPLSYGTFEGTIPKGQYGGGTVMLWDRGTWMPQEDPHAGLKKGHLSFFLDGERLKGAWDLIRMRADGKKENWLLIKENDARARKQAKSDILDDFDNSVSSGRTMDEIARTADPVSAKEKRSRSAPDKAATDLNKLLRRYTEVSLATLVDQPPEGDPWLHEIKFDGYRVLGFAATDEVRLRTRNGQDWTMKFPSVVAALRTLDVTSAVIDMEAVVLDAEGKSSFQALQEALGEGGDRTQIVAHAFDLLHLNGEDVTGRPLRERKQMLEALLSDQKSNAGALRYSGHLEGSGQAVFTKCCRMGLEGIVSKLADSPYQPGRQKSWLKVKCGRRQEFIILGYSDARKGQRALGALHLGYRSEGRLKYAGKAGTGFSMKSAQALADRLHTLAVKVPVVTRAESSGLSAVEWKSVHWVRPELLCEIAFTEWTKDGQIRHPSYQGLREDKDAADVKKEQPVSAEIAQPSPEGKASSENKTGPLVLSGINITHPARIISETGHVTKGDLAEYYAKVAPFLLPSIRRHPLSLLRCPSGIGKQCFYQRNPGKGLGPDVHPFEFKHKGKRYEYLYIEDARGLLELVQMGAIEIHPWGASIDAIDCPDRLIFDLDPAPDVPFEALKLAAKDLRKRLTSKGLESKLKCTGGKGLHVTVPLAAKDKWAEVKSFGAAIAAEMVTAAPDAYVATMSKAKRTGKIFIDYFRNDYTATAIADYAVRARPGAPVALPLDWKELDGLQSAGQFSMKAALDRLAGRRSAPARESDQRIPI